MMRVSVYLLALALLVGSCSLSGPDGDPLTRLREARQRWQASGVADYELAMRRFCGECPPEAAAAVIVSVDPAGRSVSLAESGEPLEPGLADLYPDVEGLFALIEDALVAGIAEIDVTYDSTLGYPRAISIDAVPDAIDDEYGYVVEELRVGRHADLRAELVAQRAKWAANGFGSYQLTLRRSCFCPPGAAGLVVVDVFGGEPAQWRYFLSGEPVAPDLHPFFPGVDGLFDFIREAIDRRADSIEVRFDPDLGIPQEIAVDFRFGAADEEIAYGVEKILPIEDDEEEPGTARRVP